MRCPLFPNTCYDEILIYHNCGEKWCAHVHVAVWYTVCQSWKIYKYVFVRLLTEKNNLISADDSYANLWYMYYFYRHVYTKLITISILGS